MNSPSLKDYRPFFGYGPEDFEHAKGFYADLGFEMVSDHGDACVFDTGIGQRFLVTLHYGADLRKRAGMMQLWVDDVDDWYEFVLSKKLDEKYPGVRVAEPTVTDWNWRILYVWDPGNYLLHIGKPVDSGQ